MMSKIASTLAAALLLGLSHPAAAGTHDIDIFNVAGVSGTGGYSTLDGPCYCRQPAYFSPVMMLAPGTYDFGEVRDYWVQSGFTPDGGPDQQNLWLFFSPVEATGSYPGDFPAQPTYAFPTTYHLCDQGDAGCNGSFDGVFTDIDLVYTVLPGQNAVQIGLIGHYQYTAPVPEPAPLASFVLGLALMAAVVTLRPDRMPIQSATALK